MAVISPNQDNQEPEYVYRSDKEAIDQALVKFEEWWLTGAKVFDLDDYAILFQAGVFEFGKRTEQLCEAIYLHGPITGGRDGD